MNSVENKRLHYNVVCNYKESGKDLMEILKEQFLIYIKQIQKSKELNE